MENDLGLLLDWFSKNGMMANLEKFLIMFLGLIEKAMIFPRKLFLPPKSCFSDERFHFLFEKGGGKSKKFERINFGPNVFGQQLLEVFRELSDVDFVD